MVVTRKQVEDFLDSEVHGKHGESERRAVARFVLDAMEGNYPGNQLPAEWAAEMADYLADVAQDTAAELRGLKPGKAKRDARNGA